MAKAKRSVFSSAPASTSHKRRATFDERQAKRQKAEEHDPLDAFDLVTQKHKRDSIRDDLTREETAAKGGRARSSVEPEDAAKDRLRRMIAGDEAGVVEDENDEEIDSDDGEEGGDDLATWSGVFLGRRKPATVSGS